MPAELLRAMFVVAEAGNEDASEHDVGLDRLLDLRSRLTPALRDDMDGLGVGSTTWLFLTGIAVALEPGAGVDELLAVLDHSPETAWMHLAAGLAEIVLERPDLADGLADGSIGADDIRTEVRGADDLDPCSAVLAAADPVEHGRRVADVVSRFREELGASMIAEARGPIEREVAARRAQLDAGMPVHELVVAASNGFEPGAAAALLLLPSYWLRPWVVVVNEGPVEVLTTPVADEQLQLPSQAPTPTTLRLFKALGDEGRLRLLRRMSGGPIGLSDAMDEIDVAKTTAHHHLSILRQAGLVTIREQGRTKTYELRQDPSSAAWTALSEYVGPIASTGDQPSAAKA